jgi:long-chain acyl-CoA synthetase
VEKIWLKSYAAGIPAEVDFKEITLQELLSHMATKLPGNRALIFEGKTITYRELDLMVSKFAAALKFLGVEPGDRVGFVMPNLVQTVIGMFAVFRIGAIAVPNNPLYTDRELEHQLGDADCKVVICLDSLVARLTNMRSRIGFTDIVSCHIRDFLPFPLKHLFPFVKKSLHTKTKPGKGIHEFADLLKSQPPIAGNHPSDMDDTAVIIYTGGTTGISKGVELTHRNLTSNCQQARSWCPEFVEGQEIFLGALPFFHSYGLTGALIMCVLYGWCDVLIPKPAARAILKAVHKYKVSFIPGVPTLFNALIHSPDNKKFSLASVKKCLSGAAPLPLEVIKGFQRLTGIIISEAYGLTETSPATHGIPFGGKIKPGCIGLPIPSTDAKLVDVDDPSREITAFGVPGELCVKGPQIMKCYHKRPDETAAVLKDGWFFTGDVATVDEEGYFTIVDRKKDLIISGGFNIYPRDVDEVLFSHPKIQEACAIGVPDSHSGERVKAYVVLKPEQTATELEIIDYCRERLTNYKVPKYVEFATELPKSPIGKILRKDLRHEDLAKSKKA